MNGIIEKPAKVNEKIDNYKWGVIMKNLLIRSRDYIENIELDEIYFFTKRQGKVIGVLKDRRIELATSLYSLNELIGKNQFFFRSHKSFIINIRKISDISKFSDKTYNVRFKDIKDMAYITQKNLKILKEKFLLV